MADHPRKLIRKGAVDVLRDARTAAGGNVAEHPFTDRVVTKSLLVEDYGARFSDGSVTETQTEISLHGDTERRCRFVVIAEIKGGTDPQGARDDLVLEVEAALLAAAAAGELPGAKALRLAGYVADDENGGDQPIRRGLQVFEATYITSGENPATTL